jgi:hypothetical protein
MRIAWAPFALVCTIALGRALTARVPSRLPPADEALKREVFGYVASDEARERQEAAEAFPCDLWSRDDDFHERETRRARDWARSHRVRFEDALSAIDEGLRERWPSGNPTPPLATVPPCRPRPIY